MFWGGACVHAGCSFAGDRDAPRAGPAVHTTHAHAHAGVAHIAETLPVRHHCTTKTRHQTGPSSFHSIYFHLLQHIR